MNWLAHLLLSEPSAPFRIGNLLPDLVRASELQGLSIEFLRGAECHRRIDAFTDSHPIVRRSIQRIRSPYRRFGGVLVDVFYDHFLAKDWNFYSDVPLEEFASGVYESIRIHRFQIPAAALPPLERMRDHDVLCSYRKMEGVAEALCRIGARLRRPLNLGESISQFESDYDGFQEDFNRFFPELLAYVASLPKPISNR